MPLQVFSDRAGELIASLEKSLAAKADKLPPGLKEQYDVQLEMLKDSNVPDIEIVVFPVNMQPNSGAPPFIGLLPSIGRPFTRGSIVRVPCLRVVCCVLWEAQLTRALLFACLACEIEGPAGVARDRPKLHRGGIRPRDPRRLAQVRAQGRLAAVVEGDHRGRDAPGAERRHRRRDPR